MESHTPHKIPERLKGLRLAEGEEDHHHHSLMIYLILEVIQGLWSLAYSPNR